ncbi:pilus assembly protein TadG-related protein [Blastopirellula sp. JC732]|uniref:Pilus assembly protein TadG-related protein n=1 Tax=Blastopirellula sediminis TaxID=2894196 RepID=A0A9X1MLQ1_9BACT|nr:pilus assembly protein TadG-related protein [Blastopirellula sediminis]MCC9608586.1 pilus assembly protein TadG-related protein [Blastopirellula sediminis]MCC9628637.1 pilus assembly protein TadG-related protein [Blastopirellula sediminis]
MHRLINDIRVLFAEIYDPPAAARSASARQLLAGEDGKLTLATIFVILALLVMTSFVGNSGNAVKEKIEMQNAADAAAFSSALWMARGLNAITATNHLLGELTAVCVVHEALGGPELDAYGNDGWTDNDAKTMNTRIRGLVNPDLAQVTRYSPYWQAMLKPINQADDYFLKNFIVKEIASEDEKFHAGATIYDAKINLKRETFSNLTMKSIANAGYFVPPFIGPFPVGIVTAAIASGVHFYAELQLIQILKEWYVIKAIELAALSMAKLKDPIESQALPTLAKFAEAIGRSKASGGASLVAMRVDQELQGLGGSLNAELSFYPTKRTLTLPVELEPPLKLQGKAGWKEQEPPPIDQGLLDKVEEMRAEANSNDRDALRKRSQKIREIEALNEKERKAQEKKEKAEEDLKKKQEAKEKDEAESPPKKDPDRDKEIQDLEQELDDLDEEIKENAEKRLELIKELRLEKYAGDKENPSSGDPHEELDENAPKMPDQRHIDASARMKGRKAIEEQISILTSQKSSLQKMVNDDKLELKPEEERRLKVSLKQTQNMLDIRQKELQYSGQTAKEEIMEFYTTSGGNPTIKNLGKIDVDSTMLKYSQWVRASYPYVDAFRSGILSMFEEQLPKSRAAESFQRYCDHFSMVKPLQYRTGKGWEKASAPALNWRDKSGREPLAMVVMKSTYSGNQSHKGREPWIKDERLAERYFTVVGFAYRPAEESVFSANVFANSHPGGTFAYAQGMVYNANEQVEPPTSPGSTQPNVGWDTLNWESPVRAPEQGSGNARTGAVWPWEFFSGNAINSNEARVQLNWQAKLVPVTETRIGDARKEKSVDGDVRKLLDKSKKNLRNLVTH